MFIKYSTETEQGIWEESRRHSSGQITMPKSPHWLQWDAPHLPPKLPFLRRSSSHLIHSSPTDRTHIPKRHPDPKLTRSPADAVGGRLYCPQSYKYNHAVRICEVYAVGRQKIVIPSGIGLAAVLAVGQLADWLNCASVYKL